jgi:hypothetical protein
MDTCTPNMAQLETAAFEAPQSFRFLALPKDIRLEICDLMPTLQTRHYIVSDADGLNHSLKILRQRFTTENNHV